MQKLPTPAATASEHGGGTDETGNGTFMRRDIEGGVKLYRQSIEADASRWDAHYFLGRVLASAGKADEAVAPLETAARLAPFNAAVLEELANAHAARGGTAGWEGASDALRRAAAANVHTSSRTLLKLGSWRLGWAGPPTR